MKELKPLDMAAPCDCKPKTVREAREQLRAEREEVRRAQAQAREQRVAEALAPPSTLPGKLGLAVAALIIW